MARLIALAGLPGTGKSGIARQLAPRIGAMWLRIDSMDQAIWASPSAPRDLADWTYRAAQAVATDNLALGFDVLADCVNDCQASREGWEMAAQRAGAEVKWLEIACSDPAEHRRRVETRTSDIAGLGCRIGMPSRAALTMPGIAIGSSSTRRIAALRPASTRRLRCWADRRVRPRAPHAGYFAAFWLAPTK